MPSTGEAFSRGTLRAECPSGSRLSVHVYVLTASGGCADAPCGFAEATAGTARTAASAVVSAITRKGGRCMSQLPHSVPGSRTAGNGLVEPLLMGHDPLSPVSSANSGVSSAVGRARQDSNLRPLAPEACAACCDLPRRTTLVLQ